MFSERIRLLRSSYSYSQLELAKKLGAGKKVVTVAPDNGERYLSTALYQ